MADTCPRRMLELGPWERTEGLDGWDDKGGLIGQARIGESCTFCGSLHPDRFMELVHAGWTVGPTDKPYKAYLTAPAGSGGGEGKFYFAHLSTQQQAEFIDLHNTDRITYGDPGYLYVLPFFCRLTTDPA